MNRDQANHSIECSVKDCAFHCSHEDYCSLDTIRVGCHEKHAVNEQSTDCDSFKAKSH